MRLVDATPATHEFLFFNRCDRLWVDCWIVQEPTATCQMMYVLHKVAWHNDQGVLVDVGHVRYRWLRQKSHYRVRRKEGG